MSGPSSPYGKGSELFKSSLNQNSELNSDSYFLKNFKSINNSYSNLPYPVAKASGVMAQPIFTFNPSAYTVQANNFRPISYEPNAMQAPVKVQMPYNEAGFQSTYNYMSQPNQLYNFEQDHRSAVSKFYNNSMSNLRVPNEKSAERHTGQLKSGNISNSISSKVSKAQNYSPQKQVWENIIPAENTLIILDYDDTLLPTNWVAVQHKIGLNDPVPTMLHNHLAELSNLAIKTINFCNKSGRLIVVTNASIEWVRRSGEKFIPSVWKHLNALDIEIVSARDRWQNTGLAQRFWKLKIFEEAISQAFEKRGAYSKDCCCIISIGDGEGEREACLEMWRQTGLNDWMFKSLKLLSQPSCNQLISEHLLIQQAFADILKVSQSLDMAILDYKHAQDQDSLVDSSVKASNSHDDSLQQNYYKGIPILNSQMKNVDQEGLSPLMSELGKNVSEIGKSFLPKSLATDAFIDVISEQLNEIGTDGGVRFD